jgi:hypothetical protein
MVLPKAIATAGGDGAIYQPAPPPQSEDPNAKSAWMYTELLRIADALNEGRQSQLRLDITAVLPVRAVSGVVRYFKAGVAGAQEGTYEFHGGTWTKL